MIDRFIDQAALERSLDSLRAESEHHGLMGALERLVFATRELFGATGAGLMMLDDQSALAAVVATDQAGRLLEVRQQNNGHGPCVDSLTYGHVVSTPDLAADDRWPGLLPELPERGVRAILGVPIRAASVPVGTLNVYRNHPGEWDLSEIAALEAYAQLVESVLASALQARARGELAEQLQHALDNRVMIERAVGVIMARRNLDAVEAFNQLRKAARGSERRVADVAADVLAQLPGTAGDGRSAFEPTSMS